MSNKLIKNKKKPEKISKKQKKFLFSVSLTILTIAFVVVWFHVYLTTRTFDEKMEHMVLGVDYFVEEVPIVDKRMETDPMNSVNENYFFYYRHGKVSEYRNRMEVPGDIYSEYEVGDTIPAYTTDHATYSYKKEGILPKVEFKKNEGMKVVGVLLGVAIAILVLFGFVLS